MSNIWFTSDTHFGHANIIRFSDRPFKDVQEMDEKLIANWNECVRPDDQVYHLGDFSFSRDPIKVARRLMGIKYLILGNHDRIKRLKGCFEWIKDVYEIFLSNRKRIWLSHYPHRAWPGSHKGNIHLYGHEHGNFKDYGRSTDVGVDCWDYYPVHLDTILEMMKGKESIKHH